VLRIGGSGRVLGEGGDELVHRREAVLGAVGERVEQRLVGPRRHVRRRRRSYGPGEDRRAELAEALADERSLAVEGLVEGDSEAELIGARIVDLAAEVLRGHVAQRTHQRSGGGQVRRRRGFVEVDRVVAGGTRVVGGDRGDPEVDDLHPDVATAAARDDDVVRLEVAVDDAGVVGGLEPAPRLHEQGDGVGPAGRCIGDPPGERDAVEELHRHVELAPVLADIVDLDHVRVGDPGHHLGLLPEPLALRVRPAQVEELDGDLAIEGLVVRGVDDAHTAGSDLVENSEPTDLGRVDRAPRHRLFGPVLVRGRIPRVRREGVGDVRIVFSRGRHPGRVRYIGTSVRPDKCRTRARAPSAQSHGMGTRHVSAAHPLRVLTQPLKMVSPATTKVRGDRAQISGSSSKLLNGRRIVAHRARRRRARAPGRPEKTRP
jgi:hypothetical protein